MIRQRLRERFGITLPRFDLMAQLEREPEGLRMGELSRRLMVTGGNVTGIVDQLESRRAGATRRAPERPARWQVRLTPRGARSSPHGGEHEGWIVELFDGWSPAQKTQVHALLATLKQHLAGVDTTPAPKGKRKEAA